MYYRYLIADSAVKFNDKAVAQRVTKAVQSEGGIVAADFPNFVPRRTSI